MLCHEVSTCKGGSHSTLNPKPIRVTGSSFLSPKLPPGKHCTKPNVVRVKMHVFVATITRVPVLFEPKQV